jgi:hypothetical protein
MLMLQLVDRALLRKDKSGKYLAWRLSGTAVSNLSKTSDMHIKSFINTYYIQLSSSIFLTVYPSFTFKEYIGTSKFSFRELRVIRNL